MSNYHAAIEARLVCSKCHAMNRPGATVIELAANLETACCAVCAHAGPVREFLQETA